KDLLGVYEQWYTSKEKVCFKGDNKESLLCSGKKGR
ncbi:unnamed protein product, partial [marine sediment metagenome]